MCTESTHMLNYIFMETNYNDNDKIINPDIDKSYP